MTSGFIDYYRCPEQFAALFVPGQETNGAAPSFFEAAPGVTCFGKTSSRVDARSHGSRVELPFDPDEVALNLRRERYVSKEKRSLASAIIRNAYYALRPAFPVAVRRHLQRLWLKDWQSASFPHWPVDSTVDRLFEYLMGLALEASGMERIPFIWFWPDGLTSCAIMTHDVETESGLRSCNALMDINDSFGIKSSFQLIPAGRYVVKDSDLDAIRSRGFEVNVHDFTHDGHLFDDREKFRRASQRINELGRKFQARGFRSAVLYRQQDWLEDLRFDYDMSVPNVGHLDPQHGGCCTVMPYFIGDLLEIPVTATQDYSLFHVLQSYTMDLWRTQTAEIQARNGLMSFIIHPDYIQERRAADLYRELLAHLQHLRTQESVWSALPREVNDWWRQRSKLSLCRRGDDWQIKGNGADRARIGYAFLKNGKLAYKLAEQPVPSGVVN